MARGALERRAKRLNQEALLAQIDPMQEETIDRVSKLLDSIHGLARSTKPKKPRKPSAPKPTTGSCECCGEPTKGGRFAPGHDAKLASILRAKVKGGGDEAAGAYDELKRRGWLKKLPVGLIKPEDLTELSAEARK
jgi:hypothetical protein